MHIKALSIYKIKYKTYCHIRNSVIKIKNYAEEYFRNRFSKFESL